MKLQTLIIIGLSLCCIPSSWADENLDMLTFDPPIGNDREFVFETERNLHLAISEFRILEAKFLSNKEGERWALITLLNVANDSRTFQSEHLLAFFANGKYAHPREIRQRFRPGETLTLALDFRVSKFPIVKAQTRER